LCSAGVEGLHYVLLPFISLAPFPPIRVEFMLLP
jgi:hypothetical protein